MNNNRSKLSQSIQRSLTALILGLSINAQLTAQGLSVKSVQPDTVITDTIQTGISDSSNITDELVRASEFHSVRAATEHYKKTGIARPVRMGDAIAHPYGKSQPTLTCAALRTCLVELQPGETIIGIPPRGDADRWRIHTSSWGPNGANPVVIVKPLDCDLTTNLIILTNRHLYDLTLDAPPCPGPNRADTQDATYIRRLTFYYPDEELALWANAIPLTVTTTGEHRGWESLNYNYTWKKDKEFPWNPQVVFDDGVQLYIKIPQNAKHDVAPVLFAVDSDGETSLLNYTIRNGFYITDRVVQRAALVLGIKGKNRKVNIAREGR